MPKPYTYLRNLREELNGLESADPACLRKLLNLLDNALGELAGLDDRLTMLENDVATRANGVLPD